ncbi:bifunctional N-acetylglucosamine-1-phosphate uridyltransferase/glucosamine-1-phosphate acetyltransferase [Methyloprofundus sedimenti]|uniref:Bifunctional protein GlmU n=1 Tax=Methyloprofundus sedimenti TaxID=1420851 RepID=A0A1V8M599_9GAMM|nr:bifunctional UDP-N-acetylglucosamine diphosphorylase/glucosamine-1-phosphate N-acetyltransferase GlmU [Methyloprofundus sedimenti]OQK16666.1 bifunctional N-acetylglucosamine-1-phosphate uridyltransferase/glucosamine-1-phosphate acetyltransferase [Methyloprofundus sedimenti]
MSVKTIILAAGQGTRMRSALPKVLHKVANRSLLQHVYDTSKLIDENEIIIIYGHGGELVKETLSSLDAQWLEQKEQLGTGHAVLQADSLIENEDTVLILYGDVPLLTKHSIDSLLANVTQQSMALLTVALENPAGYGRIVRDDAGKIRKIVEQKDASADEQLIAEVNTGILAVKGDQIKNWITRLDNNNAQQEFYLTDVIEMAVNDGIVIKTSQPENVDEVLGVNNRKQLSHLERVFQTRQTDWLMKQGVTLLDPARVDCRGTFTSLGQDISVDINVIFEGNNSIGNNVTIGANTIINNSVIADNVEILANCIIDNAVVGAESRIGPFARLRPQAELSEQVHVGNFVEIKKSTVAKGSKINHLSYIGDATIGSQVNIGAGTITCNYDGVNKFRTIIQDGAFIGSDTQLIAPVIVGKNATIGAGSTITKNTPDAQLTLTRSRQISIQNWQRPVKKER